MNQAKLLMGTLSLLVMAVVISCTRNLSVPVTAVVNTPTPTATKTATPPGVTATFTNTNTVGNTSTFTSTATQTFTYTPTSTPTSTFTLTATNTLCAGCNTNTATYTPTNTGTSTFTSTATNTFTNTITNTPTNTATMTNTVAGPPPTATPTCNPNVLFTAFSTAFWSGWTSGGSNGYVLSVYTQNCTYSSTSGGSQNTTTVQGSATGSLDINCTWTATSGNLLEATIESDYGSNVDATSAGTEGTNPTAVAFWIYSTNMPLSMAKVWIDVGSNYNVANTTAIPQATWTYVYQLIAPTGVPAGSMTSTKAIILDMTSTTMGQTDVLYDNITFCP